MRSGPLWAAERLTWHNDNARTGQNQQETILTPANVNSSTFGKLFSIVVDGKVDGQPLYVPGLTIPGQGYHNVLYIATENDSVYALDADTGAVLQKVTLLVGSETASDDRGCSQVSPGDRGDGDAGDRPAKRPARDHLRGGDEKVHQWQYVTYYQRLHALDLTTLAEEFNGPVEVAATISGAGDETPLFRPAQRPRGTVARERNGLYNMVVTLRCHAIHQLDHRIQRIEPGTIADCA